MYIILGRKNIFFLFFFLYLIDFFYGKCLRILVGGNVSSWKLNFLLIYSARIQVTLI